MISETASVKHLTKQCLEHLDEIDRLSHVIVSTVEADEIKKIESLFTKRGKEIETLTHLETELGRILNNSSEKIDRKELANYKKARDKLFHDIQEIDKQVTRTLIASKEAVVTEMKELHRGKKMNDGYLNASTFASTFIDIKE